MQRLILRKIPIRELLLAVQKLYSKGADYVDIVGEINSEDKQDEIIFLVKDEYMNRDFKKVEEYYADKAVESLQDRLQEEGLTKEFLTEKDISNLL